MKSSENDELFHVEHSEYSFGGLLKLFFLVILVFLPSCKSEDPEPEKMDRIYSDLIKEQTIALAEVEAADKKLEGLEKEFEKSEVRTIERKSAIRDIANAQDLKRKAEQKAEYYRIAILKRQVEDRTSYKRAFAADKPWPDPKEYEDYEQDKKMREVGRNWNARVPKPGNSFGPPKTSEEGKEKEGEGESGEAEKSEH